MIVEFFIMIIVKKLKRLLQKQNKSSWIKILKWEDVFLFLMIEILIFKSEIFKAKVVRKYYQIFLCNWYFGAILR